MNVSLRAWCLAHWRKIAVATAILILGLLAVILTTGKIYVSNRGQSDRAERLAIALRLPQLCGRLISTFVLIGPTTEDIQSECYYQYIMARPERDICPSFAYLCSETYASMADDPMTCLKAGPLTLTCMVQLARQNNNVAICDLLGSNTQQLCRQDFESSYGLTSGASLTP